MKETEIRGGDHRRESKFIHTYLYYAGLYRTGGIINTMYLRGDRHYLY